MTTSNPVSLPIIDLKRAKDPSQRLAVARQLVDSLEKVGFLFVDNVEGYDAERLLKNTQWFFSLSQQEKHRLARKIWNPESGNCYRGYFPLQPGETSYKEGFEIGQNIPPSSTDNSEGTHPFFTERNLWPNGMDGHEQFREEMVQHYRLVLNCGAEILRLVSLGCGLEERWFESMFFPDSLSTLRLLHYPPRPGVPENAGDEDYVLSCSEHSDSGFVTLLSTFHYGGLEIRQEGNDWLHVPCRPNSLVMNIGDLLAAMSGGKFKATVHRVVDTRVERFSVPFFFEPRYAADVSRLIPWQQEERIASSQSETVATSVGAVSERGKKGAGARLHEEVVSSPATCSSSAKPQHKFYGPWLIDKMRIFAEYRDILNSLNENAAEKSLI